MPVAASALTVSATPLPTVTLYPGLTIKDVELVTEDTVTAPSMPVPITVNPLVIPAVLSTTNVALLVVFAVVFITNDATPVKVILVPVGANIAGLTKNVVELTTDCTVTPAPNPAPVTVIPAVIPLVLPTVTVARLVLDAVVVDVMLDGVGLPFSNINDTASCARSLVKYTFKPPSARSPEFFKPNAVSNLVCVQ